MPPRREASRSRSPLHGPDPYNPPLNLGTIESHEYFSRWRPVLVTVQFHHLCQAEEDLFNGSFMLTCRQAAVPALKRSEEQTVFTYTRFLDRHQQNFPFRRLEEKLLFQIEQTWGFILFPEDIRLTWPDRNGHSITLHPDMFVREFLDIQRPD